MKGRLQNSLRIRTEMSICVLKYISENLSLLIHKRVAVSDDSS